jgi:thiamine-monophosphate kinase
MSGPSDPPPGEFGLIRWIAGRTAAHARVPVGIGDDCAVVTFTPGADVLVTTDMLMDGRHFRLERDGPLAVGYKALGVNLSDIAAMAGRPVAAVVAVALPRATAPEVARGLFEGMAPLADEFEVALAGGDTNAWDGPLVVSITVLGEAVAPGPVRRSGAEPGDLIYVTGPLGGSLLGRHLRPRPRIREALALHELVRLHAMIDLSDGLASDLAHILEASGGLGAVLDTAAIPVHPDAQLQASQDGRTPLEHALGDGEDFELCFTAAPGDAAKLDAQPLKGITLHRVGTLTGSPGVWLRHADGRIEPLTVRGFDHLAAGSD